MDGIGVLDCYWSEVNGDGSTVAPAWRWSFGDGLTEGWSGRRNCLVPTEAAILGNGSSLGKVGMASSDCQAKY